MCEEPCRLCNNRGWMSNNLEWQTNALSLCMRAVLPFQRILEKILSNIGVKEDKAINLKTSVWEDNISALTLAKLELGQMKPRSKHYAIKYHWFRSKLKPNNIELRKVDTKEQKANSLTKGLRKDPFERIRRLLCGW